MSLKQLNDAFPAYEEQLAELDTYALRLEAMPGIHPAEMSIRASTMVDLSQWAPELIQTRSQLGSTQATSEFDRRILSICRDAAAPSEKEWGQIRDMVGGLRRRTGGDLEAALRSDPRPVDRGRVQVRITRAEADSLLKIAAESERRWPALVAGHPKIENSERLRNEMRKALVQTLIPMMRRNRSARISKQTGLRNQLDGHWAEWETALGLAWRGEHVTLNRSFALGRGEKAVDVDIVYDGGLEWEQIKAYEQPFGLSSSAWRKVRRQAERTVRAARLHTVDGRAPHVVYHFTMGLSTEVAAGLRALGVETQGPIVERTRLEREERLWILSE